MSDLASTDYLGCLLKSWPIKSTESLSWLNQLRAQAIDRIRTQKLPTRRDEEWRFTDISPLVHLPYQPSQPECNLHAHDIEHLSLKEAKTVWYLLMVIILQIYRPFLTLRRW